MTCSHAAAFQRAGRHLAENIAAANGYRDTDACPIVLLYRQALELYLKGVILSGERLLQLAGRELSIKRALLTTHRLSPLVPALEAVFREAGWTWKLDVPHFETAKAFRTFLCELETVDPLSFSFRYPIDTTGQPSLPHHFSFNIITFAETMETPLALLDGALNGLEVLWDNAMELASGIEEIGDSRPMSPLPPHRRLRRWDSGRLE